MLYVYIGCLTFSLLYAVVSAAFGAHGFDHGGIDHGGAGSHGTADHADIPSPFNPLVIASAIATFGIVGLIGKVGLQMGDLLSLVCALSSAGLIGTAIFFGIVKVMYGSQSNSTFSQEDLAGTEAKVITPIPENGVGEIVYTINGERHTLPAKSQGGVALKKGEAVSINNVTGNIALVSQKMTIDDIDLSLLEERLDRKKENM